ncbi:hemicentin-1 [Anopheles aquasalis]|uniref:hemicentin-1 n=1 Tax=Anopheles aquasalis TaxID=42839 RepID=UPI00215B3ED6|nr:hemicentin-1 [Anopheles aquasalis]
MLGREKVVFPRISCNARISLFCQTESTVLVVQKLDLTDIWFIENTPTDGIRHLAFAVSDVWSGEGRDFPESEKEIQSGRHPPSKCTDAAVNRGSLPSSIPAAAVCGLKASSVRAKIEVKVPSTLRARPILTIFAVLRHFKIQLKAANPTTAAAAATAVSSPARVATMEQNVYMQISVVLMLLFLMMVDGLEGSLTPAQQDPNQLQQLSVDLEPEFEGTIQNISSPTGREAILTCSVKNLGRYKVGWLRASDQTVLALQGRVVTQNSRISVVHEDFHTWRLRIRQLRESDRGCYMCQINASPMKKQIGCIDVQVPPDIINEESSADIAVQEGEDATIVCKAVGHPTPRVTWKREDGEYMLLRKPQSRELIRVEAYNGTHLHLPKLERRQMGAYLCIASNDVPPAVSKRVSLSVHFAPSVRPTSQLLGAPLGSDVQLECTVEASPMPVSYWLKGGRVLPNNFASITNGNYEQAGLSRPEMLLDGPKYGIGEERHGFRTNMRLVVRSFSPADVGTYHCVSTNSLGRADGTMRLYEIKIHPGGVQTTDDQLNIIGGLAEAARGRGNVANSSLQTDRTRHPALLLALLMSLTILSMVLGTIRTHTSASYSPDNRR